jgi:hypothetical protein
LINFFAIHSLNAVIILFLPFLVILRIAAQGMLRITGCSPISLWTGTPILTIPNKIKSERLLGFNSYSLVRSTSYLSHDFDFTLSKYAKGNRIYYGVLILFSYISAAILAKQIHAFFDAGILPSGKFRQFNTVELFTYKFLGIDLFVWAYGGDVRTQEATILLGSPNCCSNCTQVGNACICSTDLWKKNYKNIVSVAKAVFSMGDMIEYTNGSLNNLFYWPINLAKDNGRYYQPVFPSPDAERALRIVHSSNHRDLKGTAYLERAIDSLRSKNIDIELVVVENTPNSMALEIYKTADIIFDQCLIGFHGYFALEAMALGKPVMSFVRKPKEYLLHHKECPILNTHITTIESDLHGLVSRRDELAEIGRLGRGYIEKYYSIEAFSGRLGNSYRELGVIK